MTELAADGAGELSLDLADLSADPFYLDEIQNDPLAFTSAAGTRSLLRTLPPAWDELRRHFGRSPLPTLLVHGSEDPIVPVSVARDWAARLPGGRLAEFAGARHDVLNETVHREVAAAITGFVWSVTVPAPAIPASREQA